MKKILCVVCLVTCVTIFNSCSNKKELDGKWDDNIKLSTKTVDFNANTDSVIIKTGGSSWWILDISVDGKYYYGFVGVNLNADHYSIKQDCFVVDRRDKNTLFIKVQENPLSAKRIITIGLEAGDYFDRVFVTQAAK